MAIAILGAVQQKFKNPTTMNLKKFAQVYLRNAPVKPKEMKVIMMITDSNMERLLQVNVLLSLLFLISSNNLPVQIQLEKE